MCEKNGLGCGLNICEKPLGRVDERTLRQSNDLLQDTITSLNEKVKELENEKTWFQKRITAQIDENYDFKSRLENAEKLMLRAKGWGLMAFPLNYLTIIEQALSQLQGKK